MRRILLPLALFVVFAFYAYGSDHEMVGQITIIDNPEETFTIAIASKSYKFICTPVTEYEWDDRLFDDATFDDLKKGQWVEVEYVAVGGEYIAKEVKILKK